MSARLGDVSGSILACGERRLTATATQDSLNRKRFVMLLLSARQEHDAGSWHSGSGVTAHAAR